MMAAVVAALAALGGIALLVRASRPPEHQPFRFPAAAGKTPSAELDAETRARLEAGLRGLLKTPDVAPDQR